MTKRRRRSSSSRSPKNNVTVIASVSVAAVAVVGLIGAVFASLPPDRGSDLCRVNAEPEEVVAVIVDASGEFSPLQRAAMLDRFYRALQRVAPSDDETRPVGAEVRVDIYNANASTGGLIEPVFSRCSTPALTGLQLMGGNARREQRTYREVFAEPLREAMLDLVAGESSDTSPILESLSAAVEQSFTGRTSGDRQAVIVLSDMLQNSENYSFYGRQRVPPFEEFYRAPEHNSVSLDLRGAKFCPILINRANAVEDALQGVALSAWWEQYAIAFRGRYDGWCIGELQL
jgi:hypothetical protein